MRDREMLELAAKAAGIVVVDRSRPVSLYIASDGCKGGVYWNPLTHDGDARALAAKLNIDYCEALGWYYGDEENAEFKADPYAATRRAIVRAAAEIGRTM